MIDFDVVTGPNPTEKPRDPALKPAAGRTQPRKSESDGGFKPGVDLDTASKLQDEEDADYVRRTS
jgi:hypothetical protein